MKIAVAAADRAVFELLEQYLGQQGHELTATEIGPGALEFLRTVRPRLALLHPAGAVEDALELCRAVKSDLVLRDCRTILIWADASPAGIISAYSSGADRVLAYPFRLSDLGAAVAALAGSAGQRAGDG